MDQETDALKVVDKNIVRQISGLDLIRKIMDDRPLLPPGRISRELPSTDLIQPRMATLIVRSQLAWLLLQGGFHAFHDVALSCLADLFSSILLKICRSLQSMVELSGCTSGGRLASQLLLLHSSPRLLLDFLVAEPLRERERLERALALIQENRILPSPSSHHPIDAASDQIGDEDVDLSLLGETPSQRLRESETEMASEMDLEDDSPSLTDLLGIDRKRSLEEDSASEIAKRRRNIE